MKYVIFLCLAVVANAGILDSKPGFLFGRRTTTQRAPQPQPTTGRPVATTRPPVRPPATNRTCGKPAISPSNPESRIVGGTAAIPYSWPWQVALFKKSFVTYQFCAGSLVSSQWIVTAGHCFYNDDTDTTKYLVKLGVFNKNKDDEPGEVVSKISEIHIHPKYNHGKVTYDITLLKLEKPIQFTNHISPICLPEELEEELPKAGTLVSITGWGTTSSGGRDSATLRQASVPIVATDTCKKEYPGQINEDVDFCAGYKDGGKDTCQGDSGGPVEYFDPEINAWKHIGITSWGNGCAKPNFAGVYSRTSAYVDFIQQYVTDL